MLFSSPLSKEKRGKANPSSPRTKSFFDYKHNVLYHRFADSLSDISDTLPTKANYIMFRDYKVNNPIYIPIKAYEPAVIFSSLIQGYGELAALVRRGENNAVYLLSLFNGQAISSVYLSVSIENDQVKISTSHQNISPRVMVIY